jgi:inner membrane protein
MIPEKGEIMKAMVQKIKDSGKSLSVFRLLFIAFLILLFLIPLGMIRGLIHERQNTRSYAEQDIIERWGGEQIVAGPWIIVPYLVRSRDAEGNLVEHTRHAFFLPDSLRIEGQARPEERRRGIYEVTLYRGELFVSGSFRRPAFENWRVEAADILWEDAVLAVEFPNMRGLTEHVFLTWNGREIPFQAGQGELGLFPGEIRAQLPSLEDAPQRELNFFFSLTLQGGRSLSFLPVGEETSISLTSPWPSPSFCGAFLPSSHALKDASFEAYWYVLSLGRSYPQSWIGGDIDPQALYDSSFGVELMTPVDTYLKSLRSVKYGILFIFLPFLAFFLFEVSGRVRVHPLQYLLVGFANCLFYLLLLSVSEHLSFDWTYLAAALATTGLCTIYAAAVLRHRLRGLLMAPLLGSAYLFLYALLQSEDYALLIGSLGLFAILAAVMIGTRRVDWYHLGRTEAAPQE